MQPVLQLLQHGLQLQDIFPTRLCLHHSGKWSFQHVWFGLRSGIVPRVRVRFVHLQQLGSAHLFAVRNAQ